MKNKPWTVQWHIAADGTVIRQRARGDQSHEQLYGTHATNRALGIADLEALDDRIAGGRGRQPVLGELEHLRTSVRRMGHPPQPASSFQPIRGLAGTTHAQAEPVGEFLDPAVGRRPNDPQRQQRDQRHVRFRTEPAVGRVEQLHLGGDQPRQQQRKIRPGQCIFLGI